jgi:hydroxymethylglutaryl-CoA lyase
MIIPKDLPGMVNIHEVGPRDGLQNEREFIPTEKKIALVNALARTGVESIQVTSVVHPRAVPQLADAEEVMANVDRREGMRYTVLVPNLRGAERAVPMNADEWELMLSVTDSHSRANANRPTEEALRGMEPVIALARESGIEVSGGMATALGCPFQGRVSFERVSWVVEAYREMGVRRIEVADTVGVADPRLVHETMSGLTQRFPNIRFVLHLHNTRGMALANTLAGLQAGVRDFDSSVGGTGGCPFAPGATGNISTEDLAHMLDLMGVRTRVDVDAVLGVARGLRETLGHPLESAVLRAGKSEDLHSLEGAPAAHG